MGIFGALNTAVGGLRAQSYALENISGNIANSRTIGFKRIETSFQDLIPDEPPSSQLAGGVLAQARATNTVQGDIQSSSLATNMAVNGDGYFVVARASSFVDGKPVFDGSVLYSRRGDFTQDKNGYLVNGAGYYLLGIPVDSTTGNLSGSVPQVIQIGNDLLHAQSTTTISYRANLPKHPLPSSASAAVPKSELLDPTIFAANPLTGAAIAAQIKGAGAQLNPDAVAVLTGSASLAGYTVPNNTTSIVINGTTIAFAQNDTPANIVTKIQAQAGTTGVSAALNASNRLVLTSASATAPITIGVGSDLNLLTAIGAQVGTTEPMNLLTQSAVSAGQTLRIEVGANPPLNLTFGTGAGQIATLAQLSAALGTLSGGVAAVNATNGNMTITAGNPADSITIGGTAAAAKFGIRTLKGYPSNGSVAGADVLPFLRQSLSGGAVTAYDSTGSTVNIQLRWAKADAAEYGGVDRWNLFYQTDANATGAAPAWKNVGIDYTFDNAGKLTAPSGSITLSNVKIGGTTLGDIVLAHDPSGLTELADVNGAVQVNLLDQNGFPAGQLQSIAVSSKGRIVGSYSNGRAIDLSQISLATFSGPDQLKRVDGGALAVTDESGPANLNGTGQIVGNSLENSNTDIADEFSKLIVTQQAYSANTKIITTSNEMVQDLLNMLR